MGFSDFVLGVQNATSKSKCVMKYAWYAEYFFYGGSLPKLYVEHPLVVVCRIIEMRTWTRIFRAIDVA